jgi:3-deoxy-D-manno-octulosonate 8-phosphate phosphatase KdsC-like HAD superfamily phosphatase
MKTVGARGLLGAPADAHPEVLALAHHRGTAPGGHGAFREFADWLLDLRGAARMSNRDELTPHGADIEQVRGA